MTAPITRNSHLSDTPSTLPAVGRAATGLVGAGLLRRAWAVARRFRCRRCFRLAERRFRAVLFFAGAGRDGATCCGWGWGCGCAGAGAGAGAGATGWGWGRGFGFGLAAAGPVGVASLSTYA